MAKQKHDQFAKDLLKTVLEPLGQVETSHEVPGESRLIDVHFVSREVAPEQLEPYGLLGRMAAGECLLEPYRTSLEDFDLVNCMSKLSWVQLEQWRKGKREGERLPREARARLWLLTPSATEARLADYGLEPGHRVCGQRLSRGWFERGTWPKGVYLLGSAWGLGVVVIDRLPVQGETLLLRLMGRGAVQRQAIEEVQGLPAASVLRQNVMNLLFRWRILLKEHPVQTDEERELAMNLEHVYDEWRAKTLEEGKEKGIEEGELRAARSIVAQFWRGRFGEPPAWIRERLETMTSVKALESLAVDLARAADAQAAEAALRREE